MQSKRLILSLTLILSMAVLSAWGAEEQDVDEESGTSVQPSNIEGWEEEEVETQWTFFGMGYESRNPGGTPQGGVPGESKAGPAAVGGYGSGRNK